ncbi:hypothetical protein OY671_011502, partial [Metschnikowia pulcherrima]
ADGSNSRAGVGASACLANDRLVREARVQIPGRASPKSRIDPTDRAVRLFRDIRIEQRHGAHFGADKFAGDTPATFQKIFQPHQIVQHVHDTAPRQAIVDAESRIVGSVVAEDRSETRLARNRPLMDPLDRFTQFANGIIGVLDLQPQ